MYHCNTSSSGGPAAGTVYWHRRRDANTQRGNPNAFAQMLELVASREFVYFASLFIVCSSSGGVILGVGAFADATTQREELLSAHEVEIVFNVAFQMLTFFSILWSLLQVPLGPRFCAVAGLILAALGNFLIASAASSPGEGALFRMALGYGLLGGGGNGPFIGSFQFAQLFENRRGALCALLSAGFNLSGYVLLNLNRPEVGVGSFFVAHGIFCLLLTLLCVLVYPPQPYMHVADRPVPTPVLLAPMGSIGCRSRTAAPTRHRGARASDGASGDESDEGAMEPLGLVAAVSASFRASVRGCLPALSEGKFWGFVCSFSWGALVVQWANGAIGAGLIFPNPLGGSTYLKWGHPMVTNATFLFSPFIGKWIDKTGFRPAGSMLAGLIPILVICMWVGGGSAFAEWITLVLLCVLAALVYSMQFAYLMMAFAPAAYSGLLTVTLLVQGLLGFVAWPLLAVGRPFGLDPCVGNFLLMMLPAPLLLVWPICLQGGAADKPRKLPTAALDAAGFNEGGLSGTSTPRASPPVSPSPDSEPASRVRQRASAAFADQVQRREMTNMNVSALPATPL